MATTLITKDTDYAIRALCFLAEHHAETAAVIEISEKLKVSYSFLRKIMQDLNRQGILRSTKGKGGGFALNKAANEIFVMDVIDIFQGPINMKRCRVKHSICPEIENCALRRTVEEIEEYARTTLQSMTIKGLLEKGRESDNKT